MNCYVCAQQGKQTPAIGMCIICGMFLCKEHALREDVEMWEGGYPIPRKKMEKKMPRILCGECRDAIG